MAAEVMGDTDDAALLAALRTGDVAAFATLLDRHDAALRRTARTIVGSDAVAAEVVQDTWVGVIRGLDAFEGRASLRTWIFQIMRNQARTRAVRERRTVPFTDLDGPTFDPDRFQGPDGPWPGHWATPPVPWRPDEVADRNELLQRIAGAIAALPENLRAVIHLRDVEGFSGAEVCELLDLTPGNQRVLLHRARARVRAALDDVLGAPR